MSWLLQIIRILVISAGLAVLTAILAVADVVFTAIMLVITACWFGLGLVTMIWWFIPLQLWRYLVKMDKQYLEEIEFLFVFWTYPWMDNNPFTCILHVIRDLWKSSIPGIVDAWQKLFPKKVSRIMTDVEEL